MKVLRILITTIVFSVIAGIGVTKSGNSTWQIMTVIASGFVGAATSSAYELIDTHGQGFKTWFQSKITHRNKDIYLSLSYLYRIEIDGKYLLVRGHRMKDRFQPIGGVYKFYPEAKRFLESIYYQPDTMVGNTDETDDLRIRIKGKYLLDFMDWFFKMEDREYGPDREFYEEIIEPGFVPEEQFRHLRYRKVKVHNKGITKALVPNRIDEVIYADIFEVSLTYEQKRLVKRALDEHSNDLCLASPEEIKSRRYGGAVEMNLGNNVPWLLGEK